MPSNFFFCMKGRKIALRKRRIQHLNKYYRMLFCFFNIGGIMTKREQNKLLPHPPSPIYSQRVAPGQRKRGAGCRRPLLTSSTSFWKNQGTGLTSFPRSKLTSLRIPLPSLSPEQGLLEEMMFHRVQKQNANSLGGEINLVQAEVGTHIGTALLAQGVFAFFLKMLLCKSLNSTKRKDLFHNSSSAGELDTNCRAVTLPGRTGTICSFPESCPMLLELHGVCVTEVSNPRGFVVLSCFLKSEEKQLS